MILQQFPDEIFLEFQVSKLIPCRRNKKQHGDSSGRGVGGGDAARIAVYETVLFPLTADVLIPSQSTGNNQANYMPSIPVRNFKVLPELWCPLSIVSEILACSYVVNTQQDLNSDSRLDARSD
jgi:hypothetical protein